MFLVMISISEKKQKHAISMDQGIAGDLHFQKLGRSGRSGAVMAYLNAGDQSGAMEMLRQMVPSDGTYAPWCWNMHTNIYPINDPVM